MHYHQQDICISVQPSVAFSRPYLAKRGLVFVSKEQFMAQSQCTFTDELTELKVFLGV